MHYNVVDGVFILSVAIVHDGWAMKEVCKLMLKKMIPGTYTALLRLLKVCNKEFTQKHD